LGEYEAIEKKLKHLLNLQTTPKTDTPGSQNLKKEQKKKTKPQQSAALRGADDSPSIQYTKTIFPQQANQTPAANFNIHLVTVKIARMLPGNVHCSRLMAVLLHGPLSGTEVLQATVFFS
jgi:hypothetical protein